MFLTREAVRVAHDAFTGCTDAHGLPVIRHAADVATLVAATGGTDVQQAAAWLFAVPAHTALSPAAVGALLADADHVTALEAAQVEAIVEVLTPIRGGLDEAYYARIRDHADALVVATADQSARLRPDRLTGLTPEQAAEVSASARQVLHYLQGAPVPPQPSEPVSFGDDDVALDRARSAFTSL